MLGVAMKHGQYIVICIQKGFKALAFSDVIYVGSKKERAKHAPLWNTYGY